MKVFISVAMMLAFAECSEPEEGSIETFSLKSSIFGNERTIRVYLPGAYDGKRFFKVLYLNDGQNLFGDNDGGAEQEWRVDEITDSLIIHNCLDPLIIVGIDNAGRDRGNEYLPWEDEYLQPPLPNPQGAKYPDFLTTELMPVIEKRYNVLTGSENTGLGGSSYGGLIALYTVLNKPDTFGFILIESPSLYVDDQKILKNSQARGRNWPEYVYLGIGTNELGYTPCDEKNEDNRQAVEDVTTLAHVIQEQSPNSKVRVVIDSCAVHSESAWSERLPEALQFLLPNE